MLSLDAGTDSLLNKSPNYQRWRSQAWSRRSTEIQHSCKVTPSPQAPQKPSNRHSYWILFPITIVMVSPLPCTPTAYQLTSRRLDLNRHPPPLRLYLDVYSPEAALHTLRISRTPRPPPRHAPPQPRLLDSIPLFLRVPTHPPRNSLQKRLLSERRSRVSRQSSTEPHDRPGSHGGHDGHDEGKHGDDDPSNLDNGLDQRLLCGICDLKAAVPVDDPIQVDVAVRCHDERS